MSFLKTIFKLSPAILSVAWTCALRAEDSPTPDKPAEPNSPSEWYGQTIRASQWRSAQDEQAGFHVPKGFVVELVASEPQIAKPMNMAFDTRGRLWLTQSVLYPFPANDTQPAADAIVVLEDKDHDGSYESKTTFADGLNIPIGVLPYQDGAIAFSIPNVYHLRDTNGDGICDERKVILGPFDTTRDTHGMVNALRDGHDGWIYACHGFNNVSKLQGTDGHKIELTSGNVFRFKPDGSRVELYTQGQVNPFGMTRDKHGFWFTADCHSKPITQLVRGGCYPSFGRPHDGLGFIPSTMEHLHGSTAISGVAYVNHRAFPESFQTNLLSGNVMTCRINRNRLEYFGATAKAIQMPDLLTSDDPWFRPVDLQFGPDGCLYIADFYNKIIGHYEVPLDHPDRDRKSGRIWRIRCLANDPANADDHAKDSASDPSKLTRQEALATLALVARPSDTSVALKRLAGVERLGEIGLVSDVVALLDKIPSLDDRDAILKQAHWIAARDLMGRAAKQSDRFPSEELFPEGISEAQFEQRTQDLLKVLQAVRHPKAASWSLELIVKASTKLANNQAALDPKTGWLKQALLDVATSVDESQIPRVLTLVDLMVPDRLSKAQQILLIAESQKNRNGKLSPILVELGMKSLGDAVDQWLAQASQQNSKLYGWTSMAARGKDHRPWPIEPRLLQANTHPNPDQVPSDKIPFWSSLGLSERYTGTWTSGTFVATEKLSFWVAGHDGLPDEKDRKENYVRVLLANPKTSEWTEVHRTYAPRNDIAKFVLVDTSEYSGQAIRIEVVDSCGLDSYAWIAIADVSESGLMRSSLRDQYEALLKMAEIFGASVVAQNTSEKADFMAKWTKLMESDRLDQFCKANLQQWVQGQENSVLSELVLLIVQRGLDDLLDKPGVTKEGKPWRFGWNWSQGSNQTLAGLAEAFGKRANAAAQEELVLRWSKHRSSYELIESLIRRGALSKDTLRILPASWWESLPAETANRLADLKPEGPSDTARATVVQAKAEAVRKAMVDLDVGKRVFQERCATCHQLSGQGKVIGPQLDGAVVRTIDRLCEDILWPNRNVDEAFRITNVLMEDGETISGLILDRTDNSLEIIDQAGKSQRVPRTQIEQEKISKLSLMPGNFEELISDIELASLIGYMKTQQPAPKP
ncbi:MAG: c-type cytochrome [Planctomycetes bacterium]|nr:c-type cytochrome [Planctomycetota bacterium]